MNVISGEFAVTKFIIAKFDCSNFWSNPSPAKKQFKEKLRAKKKVSMVVSPVESNQDCDWEFLGCLFVKNFSTVETWFQISTIEFFEIETFSIKTCIRMRIKLRFLKWSRLIKIVKTNWDLSRLINICWDKLTIIKIFWEAFDSERLKSLDSDFDSLSLSISR